MDMTIENVSDTLEMVARLMVYTYKSLLPNTNRVPLKKTHIQIDAELISELMLAKGIFLKNRYDPGNQVSQRSIPEKQERFRKSC